MQSKAFKEWLDKNNAHLRGYSHYEVGRLALACGFTLQDICADVHTWIERSRRRLKLWDNEFFRQWLELAKYETTGDEFDPDAHASFNRGDASPWARTERKGGD